MNPDNVKPLKDHVEASAKKGKVISPESATTIPELTQPKTLALSAAAQNALDYKLSVIDASQSLERLLKGPANEFDLEQFLKTADMLLKTGNSSISKVSHPVRASALESGNSVGREQITTNRPHQEKEEFAPFVNAPENHSSEQINDKFRKIEITPTPDVDAATSKIMSAQGKIFSESVKTLLHFQGDLHPDGSRTFDSDNYHFRLDGPSGSVSVAAIDGGTILAQGKVMQEASEKDIEALETINDMAQELVKSKHLAQLQTKTQNKVLSL